MRVACALAAVLCWATPASGQGRDQLERAIEALLESRFENTAGLQGVESTRLLYGAYTTLSLLALDDLAGSTRVQRQVDAKLWAEVSKGGHTLYGRLRLRYRDWNSGDAFDGNDSELVSPIGDRYWYRFDWRANERSRGRNPAWNWSVSAGRQYIHWASGIVLSNNLYAARVGVEGRGFLVDGFVGRTPSDMVDFDASRPGYTSDTDRDFWGAMVKLTSVVGHKPYLFALGQTDNNGDIFGGPFGPAVYSYDSTYIGIGSVGELSGPLLYRAELVYEFGTSASNPLLGPQTFDDIRAWAGKFQLIYSPPGKRDTSRLRYQIELLVGSGDDDRGSSSQTVGGNAPGTDDTSFNAFGVAITGLWLAPELANLVCIRAAASAFPLHGKGVFDRMRLAVDWFVYNKLDDNAPLSVPTIPGRGYVGMEFDFIVEWQLYSDLAVDLRYGLFLPGGAMPFSDARHFLFVGVSYAF